MANDLLRFTRASALAIATNLALMPAGWALSFSLTDLGPTPAFNPQYSAGRALNAQGDVVGHIGDAGINAQAALWSAPAVDGTSRTANYIPPLSGYRNGLAAAINDAGVIAGTVADGGPRQASIHRASGASCLRSVRFSRGGRRSASMMLA